MLTNLFNWLTDRDYRLSISTRNPDLRRLTPEAVPRVSLLALWILPGLALVLGVLTAFLRARGGPRRASPGAVNKALSPTRSLDRKHFRKEPLHRSFNNLFTRSGNRRSFLGCVSQTISYMGSLNV